MLEKNEVLVGAKQGLSDYELVAAFRDRNITHTSHVKGEVVRETLTMEFPNKLARGGARHSASGISPSYLRTSDRQLGELF